MGCNCGKPKRNGHCGVSPAVLQINNPSECVLFHRVEVPASMGDSVTNPPKPGAYRNTLLYYKADGEAFLYSSDGIPSKITGVVSDYACLENKPQINGVTLEGDKSLADIGVTNAINNALEPYTPTSGFADVAFSGSYTDLTDKPDIPSGLHVFYMSPTSVGNTAPIYHDYEKTNQVTLAQFIDAIASGPVQIYKAYDMRSFLIYYVDPIDAFIPDPPQYIGTLYANFGLRNPYGLGVERFSWYEPDTAPTYDSYDPNQSDWNESNSTNSSYIKNKPNLATVATSGSYNDLSNKPTIPVTHFYLVPAYTAGSPSLIYNDSAHTSQTTYQEFQNAILNGPVQIHQEHDTDTYWISNIALTDIWLNEYISFYVDAEQWRGLYRWDSTDAAPFFQGSQNYYTQVQADWNVTNTSSSAYIKNKPTVNDATLTVTQNGISAGTFTANASSDTTISLTDTTYSGFSGATSLAAGASGLVPAPAAGDQGKFLQGDGTWAVVQSGPTVVQTTGQSTTDVMSQKAVTDIIGDIEIILQTLNSGTGAQ